MNTFYRFYITLFFLTSCATLAFAQELTIVTGSPQRNRVPGMGIESVPTVPVLLTPKDAEMYAPNPVFLSWTPSIGAQSYGIQFSKTSDFAVKIVDQSITNTTKAYLYGATPGVIYYWHLRGVNTEGTGVWSATFSFTIGTNPDTAKSPTWALANTGLLNGTVNSLAASGTSLFAATNGGGIFSSNNTGATWSEFNKGLTNTLVYSLAIDGQDLYAGTQGGILSSSVTSPAWKNPATNLTIADAKTLIYRDGNLFAGTPSGVYISPDKGVGWSPVKTGLTNPDVRALLGSGPNLLAATPGGVFLSSNNGTSWSASDLKSIAVYAFAVSGSKILAATSNGISVSTDNGATWTPVFIGLSNVDVRALAVSDANILAGTLSGVLISNDGGATWTPDFAGWSKTVVRCFTVQGNTFFVGTSAGIWKQTFSQQSTSVESYAGSLPEQYRLRQNYPNPFNPTTTIVYDLPAAAHVLLTVFNSLGQQVSVLRNGEQSAGTHDAVFNATGFPSGVYFYRLQTEKFVETKKLVLIR
ncbi:MAG TPA: T9SS type A sorting domain-containing protein [Bacteroidota bacterium]|nr:T9SS type A sorting domain-containing protein [Bacteroidota bacterium]